MKEKSMVLSSALILALLLLPLSIDVSADGPGNDSLLDPERIGVGTVMGNVTSKVIGTWPNITEIEESDCYSFAVPAEAMVNLTIRKLDMSQASISVSFYDVDGFRLSVPYNLYVDFPGESDRESFENEREAGFDMLILVQGNGSYSLTVETGPLEEEEEPPDDPYDWPHDYSWIDAEEIEDGLYDDKVSIIDGPPVKYYMVTVRSGYVLDIILEKNDGGEGTIYLDTFYRFDDMNAADLDLEVSDPGGSVSGQWENNDGWERVKVIRVYGEGNYSLSVDTSQEIEGPSAALLASFFVVMMLILVLSMIVPLMIPFAFVITIIIVILLVMKGTKDTKKVERVPPKKKAPPKKNNDT